MDTRPRTKAPKAEQLKGELKGDLATYEKFGLFQRSVNQNTAYRYRGVLLPDITESAKNLFCGKFIRW
jgi:hypothetical protein